MRSIRRGGAALASVVTALALATPAAACLPTYYLALGDSIAYGFQAAKVGSPASAYVGFADLVATRWHERLVNYACPGESTASWPAPCAWRAAGQPLHDDYPGAQRDAALTFLRAHRGHVATVTLTLGGNDLNAYFASCPAGDVACLVSGAPAATAAFAGRLRAILAELRRAAPASRIIVTGLYDLNIGAFDVADPLFAAVNAAAADAARSVRARFVDPMPVFNPPGPGETAAICALTLLCTAGDGHPSDAGYRALADLVEKAR
jgi:lysophospholipase L1-like esterase